MLKCEMEVLERLNENTQKYFDIFDKFIAEDPSLALGSKYNKMKTAGLAAMIETRKDVNDHKVDGQFPETVDRDHDAFVSLLYMIGQGTCELMMGMAMLAPESFKKSGDWDKYQNEIALDVNESIKILKKYGALVASNGDAKGETENV